MAPAAFRDFDAEQPQSKPEGPQFKLGGETFQCVPDLPYPVIRALSEILVANASASTDAEKNLVNARAVIETGDVFDSIVVDADTARFHALLADKARAPTASALQDVSRWLMGEAYTDRPTGPPSDLPVSPESGSTTSMESSSPEATPTAPAV